jgi:hypothetical protein
MPDHHLQKQVEQDRPVRVGTVDSSGRQERKVQMTQNVALGSRLLGRMRIAGPRFLLSRE